MKKIFMISLSSSPVEEALLNIRHISLLFIICILSSIIISCGYSIVRTSSLPFTSIIVNSAENYTSEPGLQDLFMRVFTEESLKHGLHISESEGPLLKVVINEYKLSTLSIKDDLSAEYLITIKADIYILFSDGLIKEIKGLSSEFMETFVAPESIQALHSQREVANEMAIRNLSQRIITEMIYGNQT